MFESDNCYAKYFLKRNLTGISLSSEKSSSQDEEVSEKSDEVIARQQQNLDTTDNHQFRERINSIKRKTVPLYDVIINAVSIVFRFAGIVFSLMVAMDYYWKGSVDYMIYTVMCLIIPILMTSLISIELQKQYFKKRQKVTEKNAQTTNTNSTTPSPDLKADTTKTSCFQFVIGVIIVPCLFRYWLSFYYSLKCYLAQEQNNQQKQKMYYKLMIQQDSDVTFLRLFDTFIEVAPQKVLQIAIFLAGQEDIGMMQAILITSCFVSMAWCMGSYHKCLRLAQPDKKNMKFTGIIFHLLFNFFLSVSRTLSIALVASIYPSFTLIAVIIHILFMGNFIYCFDKPNFCIQNCFTNYFFSLMLGTVFLFHFIATNEGPQKYKILFFYVVCGLENIACSVIYYYFKHVNPYFHLYLIIIWICFGFGLIFKVIYYTRFHPNITARQNPKTNTISSTCESPAAMNGGDCPKLEQIYDPETAVNHDDHTHH